MDTSLEEEIDSLWKGLSPSGFQVDQIRAKGLTETRALEHKLVMLHKDEVRRRIESCCITDDLIDQIKKSYKQMLAALVQKNFSKGSKLSISERMAQGIIYSMVFALEYGRRTSSRTLILLPRADRLYTDGSSIEGIAASDYCAKAAKAMIDYCAKRNKGQRYDLTEVNINSIRAALTALVDTNIGNMIASVMHTYIEARRLRLDPELAARMRSVALAVVTNAAGSIMPSTQYN